MATVVFIGTLAPLCYPYSLVFDFRKYLGEAIDPLKAIATTTVRTITAVEVVNNMANVMKLV